MDMSLIEDRKTRARAWFETLRNDICAAFERLEDEAPASLYPGDAGASCARPGTAPTTPASPAAAA
jgi:coproporphyrinogen III oxidase